jgi:hypothetical protein
MTRYFVEIDEISEKTHQKRLAFCAISLYNVRETVNRRSVPWAN